MKAEEVNDDVEDEVEGDPDENEDVDQLAIDQAWIDGLSVNYPLYTYYKNLKTNFKIILGSDKIPEKMYPKWSENVSETFTELTKAVPEMNLVY